MADFGSLSPTYGLAALPGRRGLGALPDQYAMLLAEAQAAARQEQPVSMDELAVVNGAPIEGDPYEAAAMRMRRGVMPEGGRREGIITNLLKKAAPAAAGAVLDMAGAVLDIPRRAMEASEGLRTTGEYDPAPVVDAAMLGLGGGIPGATRQAGLAALDPMRYAKDAGRVISANPRTAAAAAGGVIAGAPAATAGDPGEEFGILKPQLPSEPQPRSAVMPDESQMPEKYRTNPSLRRKWYDAEVKKLEPVNAARAAEDAAMRDEWRRSVTAAQEQYSTRIEEARKAKADREANMTFLERNPWYRYVPLGASVVSGGVANTFGRIAQGRQKAYNAGLRSLETEARGAAAAGDTVRAEQLRNNIATYLQSPEPSGKLPWYGYAAAAGIAPEFAAAPTIIDYSTPGRPREEAKKDFQDPSYWAKTYAVPALLGLSAAKTGAMLNRPVPSAVPSARGAMAEVDTAVSQAAAREQSALAASQAEQARLQSILDEQAAKRAAAAEKAKATREAKRAAEEAARKKNAKSRKASATMSADQGME